MHEADKFLEGTWDDTMPGERMIVAAAPETNPSPETSHQVSLRLLAAIECAISAGTDLAGHHVATLQRSLISTSN